jgi:hypothetical protein
MKTRTLFFFIAFVILVPAVSVGQVGNYLKSKAVRAINAGARTADKEINKEIDTAAQKGVINAREKAAENAKNRKQADQSTEDAGVKDSDQGSNSSSSGRSNQGSGGINLGGLFGSKVDLKYNEEYSFNSRMYSQVEMYDKKEVTKMDYYIYFSKNSPTAGIETKTINVEENGAAPVAAQMIMDGENKCFLMLTDINGMKMGMISAVPDSLQEQPNGKKSGPEKPPQVTKTGNSKNIAGFRCDEYLYKDVDSKEYSKMWFTKDAVLNVDKRTWSKAGMPASYGYAGFQEGLVMAWESYDKDNKMTAKSEVKEINNDFKYSMSVKGYSLRQMNFNQDQKKK